MKKNLFIISIVLLVLFTSCTPSKLGLYKACATNDIKTVKSYYEKFPDELGKTTLGDTYRNFSNWASRQFEYEVYLNFPLSRSSSPFDVAILGEAKDVMNYFIDNGIDLNLKKQIPEYNWYLDDEKYTFLMKAVKSGLIESTNFLIDKGAAIDDFDETGFSTLYYAITSKVRSQKWLMVKNLLEHGANPNLKNKDEKAEAPLFYACLEEEKVSLVDLLLKYGANPDEKNKDGNTLLIETAKYESINNYEKKYEKKESIIESLLKHNANPNLKGYEGNTALHLACSNGYESIVKKLLEHNVNINIRNDGGDTAVMRAANNGYPEIVSLLIKNGASVNTQNNEGNTALMGAAELSSLETVKILLKNKANKNLRNKKGKTALQVIGERNLDANAKNEVLKELLGLNSYEEWTPARFNLQKDKNIGKRIVFKSLLLGDFNTDHTVYLMDTDVRDFVHNVYYDSYDRDLGIDIEEKMLELKTLQKEVVNKLGKLENASADFYGYIEEKVRWGNYVSVFHITHILTVK